LGERFAALEAEKGGFAAFFVGASWAAPGGVWAHG